MSGNEDVFVEIPQGKLRGKKERSILGSEFYSFRGIPYAKPPVGELRFKAPQPADGWTDVRDATEEGAPSASVDFEKKFIEESSEDCLFINVFCKQKPKTVGKKFPVMVWIHGGGFEFGSGNKAFSGPDFLMQHDVILVTFNYRLGVPGFLSLQTLECPGNFGLKDQRLALKWVKQNIRHFGGDPENITLFGISAGGVSVHYHLLLPSDKGLFNRAIIQSGSILNHWAFSRKPRENAFALGKRLGCDTKDDKVLLEFLKKVPAEDLVKKGSRIMEDIEGKALGEAIINFTFVPTKEPEHEGAIITRHPWQVLKEGKCLDVPLIVGLTMHEMIAGVTGVDDFPRFTKLEEFQRLIPRDIQLPNNSKDSLAIAKSIKEFYFKNGVDLYGYIDLLSDHFFNYGVYKFVECRKNNKNIKSPTYLYCFTYEGHQPFLKVVMKTVEIKGACHGDDGCYIITSRVTNPDKISPGSRDYEFMMKMTKLWTSFATGGIPKLDVPGFEWKKTNENAEYLEIGENFAVKKDLFKNRMEFWDKIYTSYYN